MMDRVLRLLDRVGFLRGGFDHHMREVVSGAAIALALRVCGAAGQFLFNVLLARFLGADGMGVYALALTVSAFTSVISLAGLDQALLKHISIHAGRQESAELRVIYRRAVVISLIVSSLAAGIVFLAAPLLSETVFGQRALTWPLRIMVLSIAPASLLNLTASSLRAVGRIAYSSLVQMALVPLLSLVLFLVLYTVGLGVTGAVVAYVLSTFMVLALSAWLWRVSAPVGGAPSDGKAALSYRALLDVSMPMGWVAVLANLMVVSDTLILGIFRTPSEVGVYTASLRMAVLTGFILVAVNSVTAPKFASLYNEGDMDSLERVARNSTRLMLLLAGPPLLFFIFAPGYVLGIFGSGFAAGAVPLMIISAAQMINVGSGSVGMLLVMTGRQAAMRNIVFAIMVTKIVLSFSLIPRFGMVGAALSNGISLIAVNLIASYAAKKYLNILLHPF